MPRRVADSDWRVVAKIGFPGAVGAFAGATFLSSLSTDVAKPVKALLLLGLGVYVLGRFTFLGLPQNNLGKPLRKRFLSPLGLVAGFLDATGGGGWGPVGTPAILASGRMTPRRVIGSIDTSEFLVALAASAGFLVGLGAQGVNLAWAGALLAGGLIAAPIAAWLVRHVPPRVLGSAAGRAVAARGPDVSPGATLADWSEARTSTGLLREAVGIPVVHGWEDVKNLRTVLHSDWVDAGGVLMWAVNRP